MGAVLLAVGLAIALSGGEDGSRPEASQTAPQRSRTTARSTPAAAKPAKPPSAGAGESASALNARGFALMNQGRYGEAIPLLQRAVQRCGDSRESVCAYALYNLGRSLRLAGRPAEAIPFLERRLAYDNQTEAVQAELDAARREAAQAAPAPTGGGKPGKGHGKDKGQEKKD
jgi:tetratricopeptide (TPR) repeat protein